jgi:hypothetical protein
MLTRTTGHGDPEPQHTIWRAAQDLYPSYADSLRKQHRFAREHGGQWHDDGGPARGSEGTKS